MDSQLPTPPWRPIEGAPACQVSCTGSVRRRINVNHPERRQWLLFAQETDKDGYRRVNITRKHHLVHRLVYAAFCGTLDRDLVVCHADGSRANNRWDNLIQATQKVNIAHKIEHGTSQIGEKHGRALYSNDKVRAVKIGVDRQRDPVTGRLKRGSGATLADQFGVGLHLIYHLSGRTTWKHIDVDLCS